MVSAANLALVEAAINYHEVEGTEFKTFLWRRVKGQLIDEWCFLKSIKRKQPEEYRKIFIDGDVEDREIIELIHGEADGNLDKVEEKLDFFKSLKMANLNKNETLFVNLCWVQGRSLAEAGLYSGHTESRMCQLRKQVIRKLSKIFNKGEEK